MSSTQEIFRFSNDKKFDIKGFIEDETNEEALKWLMAWPHWPNSRLIISGGPACGKTHLAHLWLEYVHGYHIKSTEIQPRDLIQHNKNFLIDPINDVIQDPNWLFDFLNICTEVNASILIVSQSTDFNHMTDLKDLTSRLNAISSVKILQPGNLLLKKIIKKITDNLGISLNDTITDYIISHNKNIKTINNILEQANEISLRHKKAIDIKIIKSIEAPHFREAKN